MRPLVSCVLVLALAGACAHRRPPAAAPGATTASSRPTAARGPRLFDLGGSFWLNLHERLLWAAGNKPGEEPAGWEEAIAVYRGKVKHHLGDANAAALRALLEAPDGEAPSAPKLAPELASALRAVAPRYRARHWPNDRASNRRWIAAVAKVVPRGEWPRITRRLSALFGQPWPSAPVRVRVAGQVGGPGAAYTTLGPPLVTIGSRDPRNQGPHGLEILFHEASHLIVRDLRDALTAECRRQGKREPRDLWHVILFWTAGEVIRARLGPGYQPSADREGLYRKIPGWGGFEALIRAHWGPYVAGKIDRAEALKHLVAGL